MFLMPSFLVVSCFLWFFYKIFFPEKKLFCLLEKTLRVERADHPDRSSGGAPSRAPLRLTGRCCVLKYLDKNILLYIGIILLKILFAKFYITAGITCIMKCFLRFFYLNQCARLRFLSKFCALEKFSTKQLYKNFKSSLKIIKNPR